MQTIANCARGCGAFSRKELLGHFFLLNSWSRSSSVALGSLGRSRCQGLPSSAEAVAASWRRSPSLSSGLGGEFLTTNTAEVSLSSAGESQERRAWDGKEPSGNLEMSRGASELTIRGVSA